MRRFDFHNLSGIVMSITKCYSSLFHSHSHPSIEHTCLDTFFQIQHIRYRPIFCFLLLLLLLLLQTLTFSSFIPFFSSHSFLPSLLSPPVTLVTPTTPITPVTVIRVTPIAHLLHPVTHCYNFYILLYIVTQPLHPVTLLSPPSPPLNL